MELGSRHYLPDYGFQLGEWASFTRSQLNGAINQALRTGPNPDRRINTLDFDYETRGRLLVTVNSDFTLTF